MEKKNIELPNRSFTREFWVGLFAIIGLACLGYLAVNIAGIKIFKGNVYSIYAEFDNVSGLKIGAPVEIAGVPVGEVSSIKLNTTNAVLTLQIQDAIQLRDDDIAAIRTKGIIGDRFVKIIPGGSEEAISSGDTITDTESTVDFEDIIGKLIHKME